MGQKGLRKPRRVRDEVDARQLRGDLEASGLSLREFCAHRRVDGRSLSCWLRNLARRKPPVEEPLPPSLRLVEVVATAAEVVPLTTYKLSIGRVCIEIDDHFREETLARLLRVVATC